ncbi:MAG: phosphoglucomutase/phosphomannomutase family protein [Elusimicrobia bacterium]|nr:phosphoglucomutase/phosphomannomutase family protein [Elusimicrobiota bacterium]
MGGNSININFGTDGWRGIIAKDFTFKNVRIVSHAIADYIKSGSRQQAVGSSLHPTPYTLYPAVVVGYDNRFLSEKFAAEVAKVISANAIDVHISQTAVTSPSVSQYCQKNNCIGIMVTASHNPSVWNGLKIKMEYGGSVTEEVINTISLNLYKNSVKISPDTAGRNIKTVDILKGYKKHLKALIKIGSGIKSRVIIDSMCGSGLGIFEQIYKGKVCSIRNYRDPLFPGFNPEPIEKNLHELKKEVLKNKAAAGFALDGDADRLGVIDDKGRFLPPHIVFPLILLYLFEYKKLKGKVVQTISLGYLSERIAKKYSLPFEEVPVGFKYICEKMLKEDVLLGGEESGGYGWKGGIPERDGVLNALLLTEMMVNLKKKLSFLVDDLQRRFGKSFFMRRDIKLSNPVDKQKFTEEIKKKIRNNSGFNSSASPSSGGCQFVSSVAEIRTYDGIKIIFNPPEAGWLLLRPSGTEPVLRTYSETCSIARTKKLLDFAEKICFNIT